MYYDIKGDISTMMSDNRKHAVDYVKQTFKQGFDHIGNSEPLECTTQI